MNMMVVPARPRGLIGAVRADASNQAIFNELKTTMKEFRDYVDEELKGVKSKFDDVVTRDKVDKVNNAVSDLEKQLAEANRALAAVTLGAGSSDPEDAAKKAHATAFDKFFRRGVDAELRQLEVNAALSTDADETGGYVVPTEMEGTIDQLHRSISVMRNLASVRTIGSDTYRKLINMGGSGSGWVGEKEARPETGTPTMRELVVNVMEIYANPAATQKSLDDTIIDIGAWIADEVMIEFAEQEAEAFITGNGTDRPRGLWTYPIIDNDGYDGGTNWGSFGYVVSGNANGFIAPSATASPADCLIDLVYALKQGYRSNASFLMNDRTALTVRKFKDNEGAFLWREPTTPEGLPTLVGKPVSTDDYTPKVAAGAFPIAFGNFSRTYTIFDRQGIRVLRDPYTNKPYIHFYTTKRVGGGATHFETMKFLKIGTS